MTEDEYIFVQQLNLIRAAVQTLAFVIDNEVANKARELLYRETERMYAVMDGNRMIKASEKGKQK